MVKGTKIVVNLSEYEIIELAEYVAKAIQKDYVEVASLYHWPEKVQWIPRDYDPKKPPEFKKFAKNKTFGLITTLNLRMKMAQLWEIICAQTDLPPLDFLNGNIKTNLKNEEIKNEDVNKVRFIKTVLAWGKINQFNNISQCISLADKLDNLTSAPIDIALYEALGKTVPSWSKFLAFSRPDVFAIYDSRVAYRLNTILVNELEEGNQSELLRNFSFYMPKPRFGITLAETRRELLDNLKSKFEKSCSSSKTAIAECYLIYIKVVELVAKEFQNKNIGQAKNEDIARVKQKVEMTLFTTGKIASDDYKKKYMKEATNDDAWEKRDTKDFECSKGIDKFLNQYK